MTLQQFLYILSNNLFNMLMIFSHFSEWVIWFSLILKQMTLVFDSLTDSFWRIDWFLTCEELRSHVDGRPDDAAGHHGLGLTKAQVGDLGPVLFVQLHRRTNPALWSSSHWARRELYAVPHQNVLQLDVSVQETLTVQEADPFHHVQSDLETLLQRQRRGSLRETDTSVRTTDRWAEPQTEVWRYLQTRVEISVQSLHDQQNRDTGAAAVRVIDDRPVKIH